MEQLGKALRQVQKTVIRVVCEKMKATEHQLEPIWGFEYDYMSQHQDTPLHTIKFGADTLRGMQKPCKAGMPGELSKLNRPCEKLKIALLALIPSQLPAHPRVRELNNTRNNRNSLTLVTQKQEALRREFYCHLSLTLTGTRVPRSTHHPSKRPGNPMLRRPRPIETPAKFKNKNKYCEYYEDYGHTMSECRELKRPLHELADEGQLNRFLRR
ncbi:LOW QUALITY PROTEIN: hypothetical protein Cgig2_007368 [Carnegiea gigantea]|uniref:Reverse transcriptase domain-containing protein n=1 Tax=Carnegiea gigantea TaxID=171969 RepID=A0A9Q1KZF4_9CARY|nr:LOW QUALITY PROTEIN: hypothetical protein Cgig2_007368 [Carnegiea gigantea]